MCVGEPLRLAWIDGIAGYCEGGEVIDLSLTPEARAGDWVLGFLGSAREVLTPDAAGQIAAALQGLRAVMQGGDPGTAFADLEDRIPSLPAHLQAALDAGRSHG